MYYLDPFSDDFPLVRYAEPDGLLCVGGSLIPATLRKAYRLGIFPWFSEGYLVYWFAPPMRFILLPHELYIAKTMRQALRRTDFRITINYAFTEVMQGCAAAPRRAQDGTWITADFLAAYTQMHRLGWAHSVEVWQNDTLVGGLYGIVIGNIFSGESMFASVSNASKAGFITWVQWLAAAGITLIDCQSETPHLASLGAKNILRTHFTHLLAQNPDTPLFASGVAEKRVLREATG